MVDLPLSNTKAVVAKLIRRKGGQALGLGLRGAGTDRCNGRKPLTAFRFVLQPTILYLPPSGHFTKKMPHRWIAAGLCNASRAG
ncbi:hypothetical protein GCM10023185_28520 [Hymenobacter saemangeumensis]|uniref:Uncharacterized protein n=1 Tax=Hymenobacter saemangeumensis TaxID=1084522 RepID=A0ABP8IL46_9BACT